MSGQIQKYYSNGRDKELRKCEMKNRTMEEEAGELEEKRESLSTNITQIRKDLDTQKVGRIKYPNHVTLYYV